MYRLLLRRCIQNRDGIFGMNLPRTQPGDINYEVSYSQFPLNYMDST